MTIPQAFYRDMNQGNGAGHWVVGKKTFTQLETEQRQQLIKDTKDHALNIRYALRKGGPTAASFVMNNNLGPHASGAVTIRISEMFDAGAEKLASYLPERRRTP